MNITGHTELSCLIGSPVAHSGSPEMYNYCFEKLGIDQVYLAFDVKPEHVPVAMLAMKTMHIPAMNVTFPHKQAVVPFMSWMSDSAKLIGAVNMIINRDGELCGYNSDGLGYVADLRAHGVEPRGKRFLMAGAGGAATSIIAQCALEKAEKITVLKRKNAGFDAVVERMRAIEDRAFTLSGHRTPIEVYDMGNDAIFEAALADADIFCNGTNVGMAPDLEGCILPDASWLRPELVVSDLIYNPLETRLMRLARERGVKVVLGGVGMLVRQGAENFRLMTGQEMPVDEVMERFKASILRASRTQ